MRLIGDLVRFYLVSSCYIAPLWILHCSLTPDLYVLAGTDAARLANPDPSLMFTASAPAGSLAAAMLQGLDSVNFTAESRYYVPGGAVVLIFINNTVRHF